MTKLELAGTTNPTSCAYFGFGPVGDPFKFTSNSSIASCKALCDATPECMYWQYVPSTRKCYLKNASAVLRASYSANSVAGPANCSEDGAVAGWTFHKPSGPSCTFMLSASGDSYELDATVLMAGASHVNLTFPSRGTVALQYPKPTAFNTTQAPLSSKLILPPYAIATVY